MARSSSGVVALQPTGTTGVTRGVALVTGLSLLALASQVHARTLAYVTNNSQYGYVAVIDTAANTVVTTISLGDQHFGASYSAVAPGGKFAYVLQDEVLAVIDTVTNTVSGVILVSGTRLAFAPDGAFTYAGRKGCLPDPTCKRPDRNAGTGGRHRYGHLCRH
jgi:hypothetical protein